MVQKADTGKIYAMKLLRKDEMLKKDQVRQGSAYIVNSSLILPS